jgi:hypothetical protein
MMQGFVLGTSAKTQACVARSSAEAELYAANSGVSEALFTQLLLMDVLGETVPITLQTDSTSVLGTISRRGPGKLMKHVEIRMLWLQEVIRTRAVEAVHVSTHVLLADMLTKNLQPARLEIMRRVLGMWMEGEEQQHEEEQRL